MKRTVLFIVGLISVSLFSIAEVSAWTGPTAAPPNNNVNVPINTSATAQIKSGDLSTNNFTAFGNILSSGLGNGGVGRYINFDYTNTGTVGGGSGGYGIWDNGGTLNFKNNGGSWQSLQTIISTLVGAAQWTTNVNDIYSANSGNVGIGASSPGSKLDVGGTSNTAFIQNLAAWGLNARTQGFIIEPEGNVTDDGAGNLTFASTVIVMNPLSGTWIRVAAGTYTLSTWGALYVNIPPTATRGTTVTPIVTSWVDGDRNYDGRDRVLLAQRIGAAQIMTNFGQYANVSGSTGNYFTAGNVGIGTTGPVNTLTVAGQGTGIAQLGTSGCGSNYVGLTLGITTIASGCANYSVLSSPTDQSLYINRPTGGAMYFRENNGTSQMTILSGGKVGINVSPTHQLHVVGPNSTGVDAIYAATGISDASTYAVYGAAGSYYGSLGRGDGYSFVGLGTLYNNGAAQATAFTYISDRTFKENIQPLDQGLVTLMKLRPVSFTWKKDTPLAGQNDIGLIAQEVEAILPGIVHTDNKGTKSIDYVRLTPVLVKAVQEQEGKIDAQEKRIEKLEEELAAIKSGL